MDGCELRMLGRSLTEMPVDGDGIGKGGEGGSKVFSCAHAISDPHPKPHQ